MNVLIKTTLILLLFAVSCTNNQLGNEKAEELVRLNYRQQNITPNEGTWMLKEIVVDSIQNAGERFSVVVHTSGFYRPPLVDSSEQYGETFYDTLQFTATKSGKVWMARDWTIIGSRHE